MDIDNWEKKDVQRSIQESVPGQQITITHIIASPMPEVYEHLGLKESGAIGIVTITPNETAIVAADIAIKVADIEIGVLDRFTGTLLISGDVESVETALYKVNETFKNILGFKTSKITRT